MKKNIGTIDKVIRILFGLSLISVGLFVDLGIWRWAIGGFGVLEIATALGGFCPIYPWLKINTIKKSSV